MRFIFAIIFGIAITIGSGVTSDAYAQTTELQASVGNYKLLVAGYNSPFASIVLSSESVFMASTVANKEGEFFIENVLINKGMTEYCFEAIDGRRLGESFTCIKLPPASGDIEKREIFLPPTVGLSGRKINPGASITASGFSMPNSEVILNISEDIILKATSDESGYYKIEIKDIPAGRYNIFATAKRGEVDSEIPTKKILVEAFSTGDLISQNLIKILLIILFILLLIILLILLLSKRVRDKLKKKKVTSKTRKLGSKHHKWMFGY